MDLKVELIEFMKWYKNKEELEIKHKELSFQELFDNGMWLINNGKDSTPRFLSIEEVAKLYGKEIFYKWLSPDGNDWFDESGKVTANIIQEMENGSVKDVYSMSNL